MMTELNQGFDRLAGLEANTVQIIDKATAPRKEGFSDQLVTTLAETILFPAHNRVTLKAILIRFYRLYGWGQVEQGDKVVSIIMDAVSLSRAGDTDVWAGRRGPQVFYTANTSAQTGIPEGDPVGSATYTNPNPGMATAEIERYAELMQTYQADSQAAFMKHVREVLITMSPTGAASPNEQDLCKLTGFLALTLLRFATKDVTQMRNAFNKQLYKTNLGTVAGWEAGKPFAPPCTLCLDLCLIGLNKTNPVVSKAFTVLSARFVECMNSQEASTEILGYISASVLTHTARNGLGLVQMLDQVSQITKMGWVQIMRNTYFNVTASAWTVIGQFFNSQLRTGSVQHAFNWARVIDHGFFRGLSPKEQPFLATIFGGVIAQVQGPGVWQAEWVRSSGAGMEEARFLGLALFNNSRPKLTALTGVESSLQLAAQARGLQAAAASHQSEIDEAEGIDIEG
ncbi:putative nucleocapsid protein [Alphahymrhavirus distinguendus]|uniref:Nucleocapsid protein n=1 Tax=Lariophagus distinguendus negative-strand RNA virus 1 TaxID=2848911 RepID=A0A8F2EG71_9VIRU|nr:putative nucleocapsid protein [Lariophagus distinguendus negative-strand RNA virus 1]